MSQNNDNIVVEFEVEGSKVKLTPNIVKEFITKGQEVTLPEFKMFTELCKVRKLNPFLNEAYLIKFGNAPATIVVSKDVFQKRADKNPNYDGKESGVITENKETGEIKERIGSFCPLNEKLVGAWCKVYRKDRNHPEHSTISLNEVAKKNSKGEYNSNWTSQQGTMLEKVAKVRALREAFPEDFNGMYVEDEMQQVIKTADDFDPLSQENVKKPEVEVVDVEVKNTKEVNINEL